MGRKCKLSRQAEALGSPGCGDARAPLLPTKTPVKPVCHRWRSPGPRPRGGARGPASHFPATGLRGDKGGGARSTWGRSATCWTPSDRAAAWSGPRRPRSPNSECPVCFQATPRPDWKNKNSSRNMHSLSKTVRSAARDHFLTTAHGVVCVPVHVCGGG